MVTGMWIWTLVNLDSNKAMKLLKNAIRWFAALAVIAASAVGLSAAHMGDDALMEPVKSVYDHYLAIQKELAKDSLKGVNTHAEAIAKGVDGDTMKMLPPEVAREAETLAKAKDLKAARE